MAKGISVFLGMNYSLAENLAYIRKAHAVGFWQIFTSLHIPEADYSVISQEFKQLLALTRELEMEVTADISPNAYEYLGIKANDLASFKALGISSLRLDYGFKTQQIAEYSNNPHGLKIEFNASTMTAEFMQQIIAAGAKISNLSACHNYYPRQNTGISLELFCRKNQIFHAYGIAVTGFIALPQAKRGPLYEGLPTLEVTRNFAPQAAMQMLFLLGVDNVSIGDALANDVELQRLGALSPEVIELDVAEYSSNPVYAELLSQTHSNRPDAAEDVVRSQESRLILLENSYRQIAVTPDNCAPRPRGSITVDNNKYLRYSGELQIVKRDLPADERVNLIGQISDDSLWLLDYIGDNQKFCFRI